MAQVSDMRVAHAPPSGSTASATTRLNGGKRLQCCPAGWRRIKGAISVLRSTAPVTHRSVSSPQ